MVKQAFWLVALGIMTLTPLALVAQTEGDTTQVDAIQCWRRVDRNAVFVGERLTMTVTCSAVETDTARTLPDQTALEPQTIDVGPFEVLDGEHFEDIVNGPYRFFQYHYTLRIINDISFGQNIEIPPLHIPYRIERRVGDAPALLGRELTYILPPEPIRVVSLVANAIVDIREVAPATFGSASTRGFRANVLTLLAALFGVLAVGIVALGAVRISRERRGGAARVERRLPRPLIVHRALGELTRVQQATAEHGWNIESASRALAALRVGGAVAVSGSVALTTVDASTQPREGQLRLRHGLLLTRTALVSSSLTETLLAKRLEQMQSGEAEHPDAVLAGDLGRGIAVFASACYSRDGALPTDELTRQLDTGITALTRLRWRSAAPVRFATGLLAKLRLKPTSKEGGAQAQLWTH